jgi:hypothetical protein
LPVVLHESAIEHVNRDAVLALEASHLTDVSKVIPNRVIDRQHSVVACFEVRTFCRMEERNLDDRLESMALREQDQHTPLKHIACVTVPDVLHPGSPVGMSRELNALGQDDGATE